MRNVPAAAASDITSNMTVSAALFSAVLTENRFCLARPKASAKAVFKIGAKMYISGYSAA